MIKTLLKWTTIAIVLLVLGGVSYAIATREATNERVAQEIRQNPEGERAARTMLLTLENGRMYPVNFLHEGNLVFMGIDGLWWREFKGEGQSVKMFIQGQSYTGQAVVVLDRPAYQKDVFSRLRPKVPKWLPDWLNGKLVVITIAADSVSRDNQN